MDRFRTLQLFIAVSLLGGVCRCWEASTPERVKAIRKSCVLVKCSTIPYKKVAWYKYKSTGYPVVYSNDQNEIMHEFKGRTSITGNAGNGDCTLRIDNVQRSDGEVDLYVWVWKTDNEHQGFYSRTTKLDILDPINPDITMESRQVEGQAFTAKCKFRTSCPTSPQLSWMGLSGTFQEPIHTNIEATLWDTELSDTFTVTRQDHGKQLSCRASFGGDYFQSTSAPLYVSYAPSDVRVDFTGQSTVIEGDSISLKCTSDCRPAPTDHEWVITQNSITNRYNGNTVVLRDVKRNTHVSCIAINSIGRGESKQLALTVHYAPSDVRVDFTGQSTVIEGHSISLKCTSDCRPAPTDHEWVVTQNSITTHYNGSTVVLRDVKRNTHVSCTVINSIGRGESKQLALTVHYPPTILPGQFCSTENGLLKCMCQTVARPNAVISWSIDGSSTLSSAFNTTTLDNSSMTVSQLTGPQGWGGDVTCTATNLAGTKVAHMYINSEMALVAGVGAACVLGIIALVTAVVICKKRCRAEPPKDLNSVQQVRSHKVSHDYGLSSDEDLYVNTAQAEQHCKEQDAESCIYENYDKRP
ncbi:sialic acid-binding Ig-like lectin 11 isoform X2 [Hemibagrus wyckioides]|nr:sialic acid-binding Ig-like lectin 11 isoform X2 [Hemibagrus wyckioides]XP_058232253.1 sialic acid-binding Ig-like lectin 11 isoform X2 [Hemibagrus wyckioides]